MKTKAALLKSAPVERPFHVTRPLAIEEVDLAAPGPGEVLVRVVAAGLCHSDLSVINGDRPRPVPMALGHEASGVVLETGAGVDQLTAGDHVVFVFMPSCGHCNPCAEGRPALCEPGAAANGAGTLLGGHRRLAWNGHAVHHHVGVSAFAEYAVVSQRSLVKIDRDFPLDIAAMFGCAVLTGVGAVVNTAQIRPGQSVAVIGLGGVGLAALLGTVAAGAETIIAVDLAEDKLEIARHLGATHAVNAASADAADQIRQVSKGGVDIAVELAGSVKAFELAYRATRRGGQTVTAGLANPAHTLSIQQVSLVAEERTVKGSYIGSSVPMRDLPRYMGLYRRGKLPIDKLLTSRSPLAGINEALEALASGRTVRHIFDL